MRTDKREFMVGSFSAGYGADWGDLIDLPTGTEQLLAVRGEVKALCGALQRLHLWLLPVRGLTARSSTVSDLVYLPLPELLARLRSDPTVAKPAEWTALQRKAAEPLAATAFAIFALAVGLFTFRRGAQLGFVAVLLLTFVYYATWSVSKLLGAQGTIPAWTAAWTPVGLYLLAGGVLLAVSWRR